MKPIFIIVIITWLYLLVIGYIFYIKKCKKQHIHSEKSKLNANIPCDAHICGALDPVSDPKYNMQQIIKQSILLEEHLANKNKRCRDCITKHFLHIIGLTEEAQMLATNKIDKYPLVNDCVVLYSSLFEEWMAHYNKPDSDNILYCCDKLRSMRKKLIIVYYFDERYKINPSEHKNG